ncbi:MAG: hypothetical protein IJ514_01950, partial [Clostridia bacterium]|nr:hypothetical protein [Clostridia bacterium]
IKFSDGVDLTIKDVLFNLYVYLDPMYMGSSTIYSTKIQGLQAYRLQDPFADEDSASAAEQDDYDAAEVRLQNIVDYLEECSGGLPSKEELALTIEGQDILKAMELYQEAVESDWNSYSTALESYQDEYKFTEGWELFYFLMGLVKEQWETVSVGGVIKEQKRTDTSGKTLTDFDADKDGVVAGQAFIDEINEAVNDTTLAAYRTQYDLANDDAGNALAKEYIQKDTAITRVYEANTTSIDGMYMALSRVSSELTNEFVAEARQERLENVTDSVDSISGITTYSTTTFDGKDLGASHDVLKIVIDGEDPRAIWNFAFAVAPMHYYSNAEQIQKAKNGQGFGVDFGNKEFFDTVLKDSKKSALPVGAGTYMATDVNGNDLSVESNDGTKFFKNNWVYYKRNPYFETVGSGVSNAKIKYMRYMVVSSDQIFNSLVAEDIDVGEPSATPTNIGKLAQADLMQYLGYKDYYTNGYGYVGVNPEHVPDIRVRQAILRSMNVALTINYYGDYASQIYRPMSTTSWAYPDSVTTAYKNDEYDVDLTFTRSISEIQGLVSHLTPEEKEKQLKLTFTIAGETKDHPAYRMFQDAAGFLNDDCDCGFDITVITDVSALKKLATGDLAVWAAAWSSALDPDLYQVYHKDSNATSVKNWGYDKIVKTADETYNYERQIVMGEGMLSDVIDAARATTDKEERIGLYAQALDMIMSLCVELPTYQRKDLVVYNKKIIDESTLNQTPTHATGVFEKLWELNYN